MSVASARWLSKEPGMGADGDALLAEHGGGCLGGDGLEREYDGGICVLRGAEDSGGQ